MFARIRNLRTIRTHTHTRPATLGLEPLETREVPANLGNSLDHANLPNEQAILNSSAVAAHDGKDNHGAQVTAALFQGPSTPPPTGTAVISGAVKFSQFGGDFVGPITDATVMLLDANGNVIASTTTDANGNYSLGSVPAGAYTLSVFSPSYGQADLSVTIADGSTNTQNVTISL